ncbi:hypothetical protein QUW37_06520 [Ligilactobacillus aviarius]|uniref:hypothetical protein n=1 Tax=Ligilactobacillus TaxID=2767887 RepID=UPI0025A42DAF|nr:MULTISPECIES: hypothetical protein [Ligilactobacillus]MDM8278883.1 hypothetical protein [Ligilactobacillus aviarius]MDO3394027.1 hypothetical protein [Ligilactobacillus sp. 110_WCHN]
MNLSNIISIVAVICTFVVANYQVRKALENQNRIYWPFIRCKKLAIIRQNSETYENGIQIPGIELESFSNYDALDIFIEIRVDLIIEGGKKFKEKEYYFIDDFPSGADKELRLLSLETEINNRLIKEEGKIIGLCDSNEKVCNYIEVCPYIKDYNKRKYMDFVKEEDIANAEFGKQRILCNQILKEIRQYLVSNCRVSIREIKLNLRTIQGETLEMECTGNLLKNNSFKKKRYPYNKVQKTKFWLITKK